MLFLGIDQSLSHTALVIANEKGEVLYFNVIKTKKTATSTTEGRILHIKNEVGRLLSRYPNLSFIGIEGLSYGNINSRSVRELGGLYYTLLTLFLERDIKYYIISPKEVKKIGSGYGAADKDYLSTLLPDKVKKMFAKKYKKTTGFRDLTDAYFIAKSAYIKHIQSQR